MSVNYIHQWLLKHPINIIHSFHTLYSCRRPEYQIFIHLYSGVRCFKGLPRPQAVISVSTKLILIINTEIRNFLHLFTNRYYDSY